MRGYPVKENLIGSAVSQVHTHRQGKQANKETNTHKGKRYVTFNFD